MVKFDELPNRGVVRISGADSLKFLQSLITNDIYKVTKENAIYALLLTPQGKFLFDLFIILEDEGLLIDVSTTHLTEFIQKLNNYKLRSKVKFEDLSHTHKVISLHGLCDFGFVDPRYNLMGSRAYIKNEHRLGENLVYNPGLYEKLRIDQAIPEGFKDMISDKSFPLEYGMDKLNAIDYKKGCYVGQELISRTTYRGTVRKAIFKVITDQPIPQHGTEILLNGKKIGILCSGLNNQAIALMRYEEFDPNMIYKATSGGIKFISCTTPSWRK